MGSVLGNPKVTPLVSASRFLAFRSREPEPTEGFRSREPEPSVAFRSREPGTLRWVPFSGTRTLRWVPGSRERNPKLTPLLLIVHVDCYLLQSDYTTRK